MSLKLALSALVATLALSSAAAAQEEQFTISNAQGAVVESFDLDASSGSAVVYGNQIGNDLLFAISNDNLGNTSVDFESIYTHNTPNSSNTLIYLSSALSESYTTTTSIFSSGSTLNVTPGDTYAFTNNPLTSAPNGYTLAVSAVSSVSPVSTVPEPSAWALTIVGLGMAGAMLRRQRRRQTAAVSA